jgi:uncharacterized protein DUF4154
MNLQRRSASQPPSRRRGRFAANLLRGLLTVPFAFCLLHALAFNTLTGQEGPVDEYKLKAAVLYNLTYFVEWPGAASSRQAPIVLCILGQDPLARSIASTIPKETGGDRPVLVRQLQSDKEFSGCHILYVGSSERKSAAHIFASLSGSSTLTVGEMAQFAAQGGMIQFSLEDQRVRFDINLNATSRAGLKISSKLLALSQIVKN